MYPFNLWSKSHRKQRGGGVRFHESSAEPLRVWENCMKNPRKSVCVVCKNSAECLAHVSCAMPSISSVCMMGLRVPVNQGA